MILVSNYTTIKLHNNTYLLAWLGGCFIDTAAQGTLRVLLINTYSGQSTRNFLMITLHHIKLQEPTT